MPVRWALSAEPHQLSSRDDQQTLGKIMLLLDVTRAFQPNQTIYSGMCGRSQTGRLQRRSRSNAVTYECNLKCTNTLLMPGPQATEKLKIPPPPKKEKTFTFSPVIV